MAEWSKRSGGVYQRLLSAVERAAGRKTEVNVCDSSAQREPVEQVEDFEFVDDFDDTPSIGTAGSRP